MDLYDEIPNNIAVYRAGVFVRNLTIPQMAKNYQDFKKILSDNTMLTCSIEYLNSQEVWKPLRDQSEYIDAISCISAQAFYLRAYESLPASPPISHFQPQPQNPTTYNRLSYQPNYQQSYQSYQSHQSHEQSPFLPDSSPQNQHPRPISCDFSSSSSFSSYSTSLQSQSSDPQSYNAVPPNLQAPTDSHTLQTNTNLSNPDHLNRSSTNPSSIFNDTLASTIQLQNSLQPGSSGRQSLPVHSFPNKVWSCKTCLYKNRGTKIICDLCGEARIN